MSLRTQGDKVLQQRELDAEWIDDYFAEIGCCLTCLEADKENRVGLQRHVWYNGKFYACVCFDCRCTKCIYYDNGRCRKQEVNP